GPRARAARGPQPSPGDPVGALILGTLYKDICTLYLIILNLKSRSDVEQELGVPTMAEPAPSPLPARGSQELDLLGEIRQTIGVLRGGWRLIGISVLICLIISIIYLAGTKRIYQARVRLLVLQQGGRPLNVANTDPNRLMEGTED